MKIINKPFAFVGIMLLCITSAAQSSKSLSEPVKSTAMKEYILLFRYPDVTYTPEQNQKLKEQWQKVIADWKSKGIFVSNQVLEPNGTLIIKDGKIQDDTFAEGNSFLGASVTILAESKEQAIILAKETPVLSVGGSIEIREPRYTDQSKRVTFIDTFIVPEQARQAFLNHMNINRNLIKMLPGFVGDHAYEKTGGDGRFNYITIAVWESEEAVANAKKAVTAQYEKEGFNLPEFIKDNGIILDRAMYSEMKE